MIIRQASVDHWEKANEHCFAITNDNHFAYQLLYNKITEISLRSLINNTHGDYTEFLYNDEEKSL